MAFAIRQSGTARSTSGDCVPTFVSASLAGSLIVAWIARRDNDPGIQTGWTAVGNVVRADNEGGRYVAKISTGGETSFTFNTTDTGQNLIINVWEITDPPAIVDIDVVTEVSDQSGTIALDDDITVSAGDIVLLGTVSDTGFSGDPTVTPGAGWVEDYDQGWADGAPDSHPLHWSAHWDGATTPLSASGTYSSGDYNHAGVILRLAVPLADCDSPVAYDVYSLGDADSPGLTYLATLCDAFDKSFRVELDGTGSGKFTINRSSADATAAILGDGADDVRFVKVRVPEWWDTTAHHGFFIEKGDFRLLDSDEEGGENLTFEGHGSLAYLSHAVMATHSYITGGQDPFGGLWRLYNAGTGSKPGQILRRIIEEAQDSDRPAAPLPLLTFDFNYTDDSDGNTWSSSTATDEFSAQITESLLSVVGRLIGTHEITVQMSPEFHLGAYNDFGRTLTGTSFGAGKVRFVGGTNIVEGLTRQVRPSQRKSHLYVYGEEEASAFAEDPDAADLVTREAGITSTGEVEATLEAIGDADLAERQLRAESLNVRIALGDDEATGLYAPGPAGSDGHFWVGDTVTLHTGTGEYDYDNVAFPVAAINVIEGPAVKVAADLEVNVELGSTRISDGADGGSTTNISTSPGGPPPTLPHTHPAPDVTGAFTPYAIAASETFTVPEFKQVLFAITIDVAGTLDVEGYLVEVA